MKKVLLTAFDPYDRWSANASWLALVELLRNRPADVELTTRRYPVDFLVARQRLEKDLREGEFDYSLHVGQAPGTGWVRLEAIGLNVGGTADQSPDEFQPLIPAGPVAYRSDLPLVDWARQLRSIGIPTTVSYHAGTYLCNAVLYWALHLSNKWQLPTRSTFVHLPLATSQVVPERRDTPSLPSELAAAALREILASLA